MGFPTVNGRASSRLKENESDLRSKTAAGLPAVSALRHRCGGYPQRAPDSLLDLFKARRKPFGSAMNPVPVPDSTRFPDGTIGRSR